MSQFWRWEGAAGLACNYYRAFTLAHPMRSITIHGHAGGHAPTGDHYQFPGEYQWLPAGQMEQNCQYSVSDELYG